MLVCEKHVFFAIAFPLICHLGSTLIPGDFSSTVDIHDAFNLNVPNFKNLSPLSHSEGVAQGRLNEHLKGQRESF